MAIQRFLHFFHFTNNFSVTGTSTFLLLLIFPLLHYHNQFGITKNIKINSNQIYAEEFAKQNIISLYHLLNTKDEFKTWGDIKISYELSNKWRQIINSVTKTWKKVLKENQSDRSNLVLLDHQLLKNNRTLEIEKMKKK